VTRAPDIRKIRTIKASVGAALSLTVRATGYPAPALAESGPLPGGLSFTDNGNGTAVIAGTPAAESGGGRYPVTITATNILGTRTRHFTIVVSRRRDMATLATRPIKAARGRLQKRERGTLRVTHYALNLRTPVSRRQPDPDGTGDGGSSNPNDAEPAVTASCRHSAARRFAPHPLTGRRRFPCSGLPRIGASQRRFSARIGARREHRDRVNMYRHYALRYSCDAMAHDRHAHGDRPDGRRLRRTARWPGPVT